MGLVGIVFKVIGVVVLVLVGLGAYLFFTDYEAKATITDTGTDGSTHYAMVTPKLLPGWHYKATIPDEAAPFVCKGYQVHFRVNTHAVKVYDAKDVTLVYDSATNQINKVEAFRCATSNGVLVAP